jgi:DHA1 family bicyclomycin/chloramphenicol resistance-like MFS transporter
MNPRLLTFMVAFAAFLGPFTQTVYAPILPELGAALSTTPLLINLSISIFTFVLAFMQIVYGPLVDRRGRRGTLLVGLAVYIVASLGCFLAQNIETLLVFRALQAVGIAAGAVVAVTVIGDRFEGAERGRAMGSFQMMVALGPVVGPVVGGFIGEHVDFHYVFLLLAVVRVPGRAA